jgi:hypothetical protein
MAEFLMEFNSRKKDPSNFDEYLLTKYSKVEIPKLPYKLWCAELSYYGAKYCRKNEKEALVNKELLEKELVNYNNNESKQKEIPEPVVRKLRSGNTYKKVNIVKNVVVSSSPTKVSKEEVVSPISEVISELDLEKLLFEG